jgi:hypothetical protein
MDGLEPVRVLIGDPLLVEELALDPVRVTLHLHRAALHMVQRVWREVEVVGDEIALRQPRRREVDLLEVRERDVTTADAHPPRRVWRSVARRRGAMVVPRQGRRERSQRKSYGRDRGRRPRGEQRGPAAQPSFRHTLLVQHGCRIPLQGEGAPAGTVHDPDAGSPHIYPPASGETRLGGAAPIQTEAGFVASGAENDRWYHCPARRSGRVAEGGALLRR